MYWIALATLVPAAAFDLRKREIPDVIPLALLVVALLGKALGFHPVPWGEILIGAGAAFAVSFALFARGGLGGGDVKLATALGAALGARALVPFAVATGLLGGICAFVLRLRRRREAEIAYALVVLAGLLALLPVLWLAP